MLSEGDYRPLNTYDFDQTIYVRDSSVDFYLYCMRRYPRHVLPTVFKSLVMAIRYHRGRIDTKRLKEQLFSFLPAIDAEREAMSFWQTHKEGVGRWYLEQKRDDDVILSASPEFLLRPIADELKVALIATPMDPATGKINGLNCHDAEKVRRFYESYPGAHTERFYSDSLSDTPMAGIADQAFLVKKGKLSPWPNRAEQET